MTASPRFVSPWLPKTVLPSILFTGAKLIDPVDGRVHPNASMHMKEGLIHAVSLSGTPITTIENTTSINLEGRYICP